MNTYDEMRDINIARNNQLLESLGFVPYDAYPQKAPDNSRKGRKRNILCKPAQGIRSSKRLKLELPSVVTGPADSKKFSRSKDIAYTKCTDSFELHSHPALKHFDNEPAREGNNTLIWDAKKTHQHLQMSASKRTVATTGCAGYGAALAKVDGGKGLAEVNYKSGKGSSTKWTIQVISEGVGGFSVGICAVSSQGPYKSMGNRPDSWVLHSSGQLLHNRSAKAVKGCEGGYIAGDIVEIEVSVKGELIFKVNDTPCQTNVIIPTGKYVLCCQPYMGGICKIK